MGKYLKTAFWNRWNLLALIGSAAFAAVGGRLDIGVPLIAAAELAYLAFVATHPKYQKYIDVTEAQSRQAVGQREAQGALDRILRGLPRDAMQRYQSLRGRCLDLRRIAADLKGPNATAHADWDRRQTEGLDRLLWVFLRLLFTKQALEKFFQNTDVDRMRRDLKQLEQRLAQTSATAGDAHAEKIRRTLEDNIKTSRARLENYQKALANYEFVGLELDRLENKIQSLAELAVNRQEPDYITSQVTEVASSMLETEATISELDFLTQLGDKDDSTPQLLKTSG